MTFKKSLKYQKRVESEAINRGKTTQWSKEKKHQTLHRKLKIEQHGPH